MSSKKLFFFPVFSTVFQIFDKLRKQYRVNFCQSQVEKREFRDTSIVSVKSGLCCDHH